LRSITIKNMNLYVVALPYVEPLTTSFGTEPFKAAVLIEVITEDGIVGWGEASVETKPGYGPETTATGYHILKHFVLPRLIGKTINGPHEVPNLIKSVRGNKHAKHGAEGAIWDAFARANDMRLADLMASYLPEGHASLNRAVVGVSIGIQPSVEKTLEIINKRLGQGYQRIKLKIMPGWDVEMARPVRAALPNAVIMLDANSAYTLADTEHLAQLDELNLLMVEQPLGEEDIYEHSKLRPHLKTPICLDESIKTVSDLKLAIEIGAIGILNLKPARVGGFTESLEIYKVCVEHNLPLWIGGMLETGIGRAANVALASLPGVTLPCDISATDRYYNPDLTEPPFVLQSDSTLCVPDGYGIGVEIQQDRLEAAVALWKQNELFPIG
jgi:O-succinylbenzoate synthase